MALSYKNNLLGLFKLIQASTNFFTHKFQTMKNLIFILTFIPFLAFGQMSSAVKDSLTIGTVAKDTVMTVHTSKTGSKFLVLWSDKTKKFYKVYLPKRKD